MGLPQLAMPLFSDTTPIPREQVVAAWQSMFADGPDMAPGESTDGVVEYKIEGERSVLVAHIPMPVPIDEVLGAVRSSWMWQVPDEPVRSHRAHAIVTATDQEAPLAAAWDVARVSAALLAAGSGAALYWGNSRQTHTREAAIQFVSERETPPVPLCVGITISVAPKKGLFAAAKKSLFSAATHGLEALGHKELEVRDTKMGIGDLRMTLLDLASYVLENGPVLEHGQTFGPSANVRWRITHEPSKLVDGRDAIVLGIP
ncbi:MAG TPA: DUF4261 domain-containing protein [Kofleriaceae bacterium]